MKNPYDQIESHRTEVSFGKRVAVGLSVLFLMGIWIVPVARHGFEFSKPKQARWLPVVELWRFPSDRAHNQLFRRKSKNPAITREQPNVRDHLQAFEAGVKESSMRDWTQQNEQLWLTKIFNHDTRKVVRGRDGWLFLRHGVEALTGRGPLLAEPDSVMKDPERPLWNPPLPIILEFAEQLKQRGVELMIVPIPIKPMIYPEMLHSNQTEILHRDQLAFYNRLRDSGIEVVDMVPHLLELKMNNPSQRLFLRQDTHWTAAASESAAAMIAERIKQKSWYAEAVKYPSPRLVEVDRTALGDLVGMLGLPEGMEGYGEELQVLKRVLDANTGRALDGDLESPISVIGDSFINIYEESGLGFGHVDDEGLIGAGFVSHLANYLSLRPQVVAINGEGATGARQMFASLPDNLVRSRKLVVWAMAARDFLLSESAGNRAGVTWRTVQFNPESETFGAAMQDGVLGKTILSGVLKEKSAIPDPVKTQYSEALYSVVFEDIVVESGEYYDPEAFVFLWAFRDNQLLPSAKLQVGHRYRFSTVHLNNLPEVSRKAQFDDLTRFDIDHLFTDDIESAD